MPESDEKPLVVIRSLVYNHEPYLRDCLEGFVMQQTTFPFVAVVHDDCSTDGSAAIIREYAEKYPHIIKPVCETENLYSKRNGSLGRAMDEACGKYGAKYYALCEGDDYWTDPHKLQKRVDFLEAHPDYTMVCTDAVVRTPRGDLTEDDFPRMGWHRYHESRDMAVEDIIEKGGWFIHTASIVYRGGLREAYPAACRKAPIGDYPLQIFAALKGKVYYFHEKMVVYRWWHDGSWSSNEQRQSYESRTRALTKEIDMLLSLNEYSCGHYSDSFQHAITSEVWRLLRDLPERAGEICDSYKKHLLYREIKNTFEKPRGLVASLFFLFKRACYHPYYPNTQLQPLLLPFLRPFYSASQHKRTVLIGGLPLITFVKRPDSRNSVYLCGVMIR